jgi:hypothetical protein
MAAPAAQERTQRATAAQPVTPSRKKPAIGRKLVAGIGVCVTLAAVAAITSLGGPPASNLPPASPQTVASINQAPLRVAANTEPAFIAMPAAPAQPSFYAPAAAPLPPQTPAQCSLPLRKFYVAGNGTVRIHAGDYISPPVELGPYPQQVTFPVPRPEPGREAIDTILVEGRASTVVMTSDLPGFRMVFNGLRGSSSFNAKWAPLRNC